MSRPEQTLMRLVACWGAVIVLCLPALAETSIPDRERMEVGNALFWQAVIPATANSPGRFGAHYKTRVVIFNPTSRDYTITARLYDSNGPARRSEIRIDSGQVPRLEQFSGRGLRLQGRGAVWLRADDQDDLFYMTAEVYTDSANGCFSTTVVSGIIPTFVSSGQPDFRVVVGRQGVDHEAGIGATGQDLDFGHHPTLSGPALVSAVGEVLEDPGRLSQARDGTT